MCERSSHVNSSIAGMDHHPSLPSPRLPTEICDHILDHLWNDRKTLKVCSLVTREWLPTTRKHLFSFVRIIDLRLVTFAEMIMHSEDALALCIRKLLMVWGLNEEVPIPTSIPRMLASLGRLEKLTLYVSTWDDCYFSTETITWPVLPMVKALDLSIGTVKDVISLQRFICACPSLSSLMLWITSQSDGSHTHSPTVISRSILIDIFHCRVRESDPVLGWLLQGGLKLRARRLAIIASEDLASVNFLKTGDTQSYCAHLVNV
ncbi:uncharacterized protein LAESUDRAFT_88701 [Laetiporus sulphureus 93-53]|uniref:F-box domain-containing protein n=1 Tax=Laetiporus sulphureus 93-53 TaxID=1314785 RepID=A0A165EXL2_9APHY|nr:uncharacterized protein LAESUDRAFT_88701 [Laetiporus sulphureus 93-53]KZT07928.1 hypothetical protein LAESUDRAFT_88701 [Laetiporus sulphureus 93-53]